MASLAEHLFAPPVTAAPPANPPLAAELVPIGLFCMGLSLFVFSCSVMAYCRILPQRR